MSILWKCLRDDECIQCYTCRRWTQTYYGVDTKYPPGYDSICIACCPDSELENPDTWIEHRKNDKKFEEYYYDTYRNYGNLMSLVHQIDKAKI